MKSSRSSHSSTFDKDTENKRALYKAECSKWLENMLKAVINLVRGNEVGKCGYITCLGHVLHYAQ